MEPIVEGKVKSVYQGVDKDQVLIHYHDKVTAGNGEKEDYPEVKVGSIVISLVSFSKNLRRQVSKLISFSMLDQH